MTRCIIFIVLMITITFLSACAMQYSRVEMDYGTSFKLSKFNQIANPEAEKNLEPVYGFDGQAAQVTIKKYRKDFEKAPPTPMFSIGTIGPMLKK